MTRRGLWLLLPLLGSWTGAASPAHAAECDVTGSVLDAQGQPVVDLDIRLAQGTSPRHTVTDEQGRFRFAVVPEATEVVAVLGEGGPTPRFTLMEGNAPVELRAPVDPSQTCEINLGPEHHPMGADLLALVQGIRRGMALMPTLGIRSCASPLEVRVNDAAASPTAAYWSGTSSFHPEDILPSQLILGTDATRGDDPGAPDNREYHEVGHHALACAFAALPRSHDEVPDGGYHHDPSSAHAWTEGFAIAYAAMVAQQVEQRSDPGRYRVEGAMLDLEYDYQPWDLRGTDSIAVASLLWDVLDGPTDAVPGSLELRDPRVLTDAGVPHLLVGRVFNPSESKSTAAVVRVEGEGIAATAPVAPAIVPPQSEGWFAIPLPEALATRDDPLADVTLKAVVRPAVPDDDPVQIEPSALWAAIAQFRSANADSNGRLFDVADLYQALRGQLGGKDADADGRDDIDQLFIAHGLFADLDGDRTYDPDETLGLTSHPARTVEVDGQAQTWPALDPRRRLEVPEPLRMQVEHDPDTALMVLTAGSAWGGYVATPDRDGSIRIVPPPSAAEAAVMVVGLAPGRRPTVVWSSQSDALLTEIERRSGAYLAVNAQLPEWTDHPEHDSHRVRWPRLAFIGGALLTVLGLLLVGLGWPRVR